MSIPVTSNPANLLATPAATYKKNPSSEAPEASFGQVLKREVADRKHADGAAKSKTKEADGASKTETTPPAKASSGGTQATSTDKANEAENDSAAKEAETSAEAASAAAAAASTDLLALVASIAQTGVTTVESDPASAELRMQVDGDGTKKSTADVDKLMTLQLEKNLGLQAASARNFADAVDSAGAKGGRASTAADSNALQADVAGTGAGTGAGATADTTLTAAAGTPGLNTQAARMGAGAADSQITSPQPGVLPFQQALNTQATGTPLAEKLTPQVGTPAWDQAVGQKVVWMSAGGQQSASLTLNPPDLGPLQIVLNVNNSQASATFIAPHAEVRQALEAAMPKLREMLDNAGIQLGQADVSAGTPQHNGFDRRPQHASQSAGRDDPSELPLTSAPQARTIGGLGMVDTFA